MREEIAKIIRVGIGKGLGAREVADQILSLPVGNGTWKEVLDLLPRMVEAIQRNTFVKKCNCAECRANIQALTLPNGELFTMEKQGDISDKEKV